MVARSELILRWSLYGAAGLLTCLLQGLILQRLSIWGVMPFLYPALAAMVAVREGALPAGAVYALALGAVCDLALPGAIPCFYTLVFPVVGLLASLLSQSVLPAGFLCSLVGTALAFFATGLFHCLLLWVGGKAAWGTAAFLALREFCVTAPLIIPVTLLFRAVFRKTHLDI